MRSSPRSIRTALGVLVLVTLAASGSEPKKLNPTPEGVSYTYTDEDDLKKVTDKAMNSCSEHGKIAKLKTISNSGDEKVAIFDCV